jgi:hypothetical protein
MQSYAKEYGTTVDSDTFHPHDDRYVDIAPESKEAPVLALPDAPAHAAGSFGMDVTTGNTVSLDHLGPIVGKYCLAIHKRIAPVRHVMFFCCSERGWHPE